MRVLFLATYFPKPGNALMGTWALAQAQALAREGIDLRVVSLTSWVPSALAWRPGARVFARCPPAWDWGAVRAEYPRWLFYQVDPLKRWAYPDPEAQLRVGWLSARRWLRRAVRQWAPDVVYAHHTAVNGYVARRLQAELGVPYVVTDMDFDEVNDCSRYPGRRRVYAGVMENAHRVVLVARRLESDVQRLFPAARTGTIHFGVDEPPAAPSRTPRPGELAGKTVVFSCGMFYERKAIPLLVHAFARAASRHPEAVLRIAGDGAERPRIEAAIRETGMADRVTLLGKLSHEAMSREMVWSDLFALVGWDEPFAVVFVEAMASGKPLLVANDGGVTDVFLDGVHGHAVPPRDLEATASALDRLLSEPERRRAMGLAARALWAARLTWSANARAFHDVFRAAAASRRPSG